MLTNIKSGSTQPIASFTVDKYNVCSGSVLNLFNTSTGSNAYEWFIEGSHYSNSRDTSAILIEGCYDLKEIKLIATDTSTGISDSATQVVEVFDTCFFHLTGTFINCPGDTIRLAVNTEETQTQFYISDPVTILTGCQTCPSIEFILLTGGTYVDRTSTYDGGCSEVTSYEYVCWTTGIELPKLDEISVFPNPTTGILQVNILNYSGSKLSIADMLGNLRHEQSIKSEKVTLDLSVFPAGIYVIRIFSGSEVRLMKKVLKH
jgi:hypothetical protein